jgi:hypothetical protein
MGSLLTAAASLFGFWAFVRYVALVDMRLDSNTYKTLYDVCGGERKVVLYEEFVSDGRRRPVEYVAFCFFRGAPWFYINHSERLMQAGFNEKDHVTVVTCPRWRYGSMKSFLRGILGEMQLRTLGVPVEMMAPYGTDKIGSLREEYGEPVMEGSLWSDIEAEVAEVAGGLRKKTSALLYGSPGNGKSFFVKYLATKYRLPVMIFTLSPDWTNHDLLLIFSQIPRGCMVLFEDFDNYFHGRTCVLGGDNKNIKFSFDIILNGLDGAYTTHEGVIFIMTVNDIGKVDEALKSRPSRFKFVREFGNPGPAVRARLLSENLVVESEGMSLDQVFLLRERRLNSGISAAEDSFTG